MTDKIADFIFIEDVLRGLNRSNGWSIEDMAKTLLEIGAARLTPYFISVEDGTLQEAGPYIGMDKEDGIAMGDDVIRYPVIEQGLEGWANGQGEALSHVRAYAKFGWRRSEVMALLAAQSIPIAGLFDVARTYPPSNDTLQGAAEDNSVVGKGLAVISPIRLPLRATDEGDLVATSPKPEPKLQFVQRRDLVDGFSVFGDRRSNRQWWDNRFKSLGRRLPTPKWLHDALEPGRVGKGRTAARLFNPALVAYGLNRKKLMDEGDLLSAMRNNPKFLPFLDTFKLSIKPDAGA